MKQTIKLFILATLLVFTALASDTYAATISSVPGGGNWNNPKTWVGETIPGADDRAIINGDVRQTGNYTVNELIINAGATLKSSSIYYSRTLTVRGDIRNNGQINPRVNIHSSGNVISPGVWKSALTLAGGEQNLIGDFPTVTLQGNVTAFSSVSMDRLI